MIIYEVNLKVNEDVVSEYLLWLDEHIYDMLKFPGFETATVHKIDSTQFVVSYEVDTMESLQNYFDNHAPKMRGDGITKFANKFSASRRILEVMRKY